MRPTPLDPHLPIVLAKTSYDLSILSSLDWICRILSGSDLSWGLPIYRAFLNEESTQDALIRERNSGEGYHIIMSYPDIHDGLGLGFDWPTIKGKRQPTGVHTTTFSLRSLYHLTPFK